MDPFSIQVDIRYLELATFEITQSAAIEQGKDKTVFE
jgi:hypothetical protein